MFGFNKNKPPSHEQARCAFDDSIRIAIATAIKFGVPKQGIASMLQHFGAHVQRSIDAEVERRNYATVPPMDWSFNLPQ